jgi:hypothetical protein
MKLTSHLSDDRRAHVEGRLRANLMAWLTTVRPDGRPDSVPVWFLRQYVVKYAERIGALFGTASQFAELYPEALIITPGRLHA